ncbi:helix-turn-helix transcriptional regulator [Oerskovia flava]|uniref:helix-turn-helix transcriptional regulator n=1 Tax=Oerskovia flava TaxID=2986422 RepID=UPI00223EAB64|nr:helix-turn-helix transcriptional regulator [Oerskovia sp. JB1-3-2]
MHGTVSGAGRHGAAAVHVVSRDPVLASSIAAGLDALGWSDVRPHPCSTIARELVVGSSHLVLVTDEDGHLPDASLNVLGRGRTGVGVLGSRLAARTLLAAARRGAWVVDGDLPLLHQLRALDRHLSGRSPRGVDAHAVALLHALVLDLERVESLTRREREVLARLVEGMPAAEIARSLVLSLTTVRSHIRAILTKLGTTSQLAAVATLLRVGSGSAAPDLPQN